MTLKSSVVIFQTLEPLQPRWPHWPLQPQRPLQPQKPYFTKELRGPDSWIVPGTKMTNTVPFLLNELSKIQIFTDILYPFCQRRLRPADTPLFWKPRMYIKNLLSQDSKTTFRQDFTCKLRTFCVHKLFWMWKQKHKIICVHNMF